MQWPEVHGASSFALDPGFGSCLDFLRFCFFHHLLRSHRAADGRAAEVVSSSAPLGLEFDTECRLSLAVADLGAEVGYLPECRI